MTDELLHENADMNARLNNMKTQYGWIDPDRYVAEEGLFVLHKVGQRYVGVMPLIFTSALIVGTVGDKNTYLDRWCYRSVQDAIAAGDAWDGDWPKTEPQGWHRHPATGRRRENGDPSMEEVRM